MQQVQQQGYWCKDEVVEEKKRSEKKIQSVGVIGRACRNTGGVREGLAMVIEDSEQFGFSCRLVADRVEKPGGVLYVKIAKKNFTRWRCLLD